MSAAETRLRSVPLKKLRFGVAVSGAINGSNRIFTAPEKFLVTSSGIEPQVYYNGQRLVRGDDYVLSEAGGPGSGYDVFTFEFSPRSGDKVQVDYIAA